MSSALIYSSQSGNTKKLALAIQALLPPETPIFPIGSAPRPDEYDSLVLAFWVHRAKPDPLMRQYLETIKGKTVIGFGTLVARPDSDHARKVIDNFHDCLAGNRVLGCFLCQGRLAPERFAARMSGRDNNSRHPLTEERLALLKEAERHPNENDLEEARRFFKRHCQEMNLAGRRLS